MSLTAALNSARSSLSARSLQTAVTSENIANVDNVNYTRRQSETVSQLNRGLRVSVTRAEDREVFSQFLGMTSRYAEKQSVVAGLEKLERVIGDPETEGSPAALMARFQSDLQAYAAMPDNTVAALQAVRSAKALAAGLNEATAQVARLRAEADAETASSVERINALLEQFHIANQAIVQGSGSQLELAAHMDTRDSVLAQLAEELDIKTVVREGNDMAIYTGSGVTLYETRPRAVVFEPTPLYTATTTGNSVYVDGVPITGAASFMKPGSGRLHGLAELRDGLTVTYQNQLDEMARGLIEAFAEQDRNSPPAFPDAPGLFTWPGAPAMPAAGVLVPGLAAGIMVNPNVDPDSGGNVALLRDGGIADPANPAYLYNTNGSAGFTDRLLELYEALEATRTFDPAAGLEANASLKDFAVSSVSWFENLRSAEQQDADYRSALLSRTSEALSRSTGVDLDTELAVMMELERSYEASARLLATVNAMYASLLEAVR